MNGFRTYMNQFRYYPLMVSLLALLIVPSVIPTSGYSQFVGTVLFTFFLVFSMNVFLNTPNWRYIGTGLIIVTVLLNWLPNLLHQESNAIAARLVSLLIVFSICTILVLKQLTRHKEVDLNVIAGAISGYLMIGLTGGTWFSLLALTSENAITTSVAANDLTDMIYYSFVTMSTLGYGDILPVGKAAKMSAVLLTIMGQMYMAVVMGILIGKYLSKRSVKN